MKMGDARSPVCQEFLDTFVRSFPTCPKVSGCLGGRVGRFSEMVLVGTTRSTIGMASSCVAVSACELLSSDGSITAAEGCWAVEGEADNSRLWLLHRVSGETSPRLDDPVYS